MHYTNHAELTNALVAQNNDIAAAIERSEDAVELNQAEKMVTFVADVWTALGYGYKLVELRERVKNRAKLLYNAEAVYINSIRKNCRTMNSSRKNLALLALLKD